MSSVPRKKQVKEFVWSIVQDLLVIGFIIMSVYMVGIGGLKLMGLEITSWIWRHIAIITIGCGFIGVFLVALAILAASLGSFIEATIDHVKARWKNAEYAVIDKELKKAKKAKKRVASV